MTVFSAVAVSVLSVGVAFAASGGGYSPGNQNCPDGASDFAMPNGQTYPGCHDVHIALESGQMQNGDIKGGNTHYADLGINQEPNASNRKGNTVGVLENFGKPGYSFSPHAGCISVNTDGTGTAPAPEGTATNRTTTDPTSAGNAANGCGGNPKGLGFAATWDYYQFYCPLAADVGNPCDVNKPGETKIHPYTGTSVDTSFLKNGLLLYFGADDNLDAGEHDGLGPYSDTGTPYQGSSSCPPDLNPPGSTTCKQHNNGAHNGSSDGGAILASVTPQDATKTPSQTNPEGLANFSVGFCADGICLEATTQRQSVYQGCGAPNSAGAAPCAPGTPDNGNVYDYGSHNPSVNSEPPGCSSGDAPGSSDAACGPGGMNGVRSNTPANMNAEPGVQIYSDPDSQRSPAAPWPTPGVYVGTCGVYAGASWLPTAGAINSSPVGNHHGQVAVNPTRAC